MYITRIELKKTDRHLMQKMNNIAAIHSFVESSFPSELENNRRTRKLWRIDRFQDKEYLIIVSESVPNQDKLEKFAVENSFETRDYSVLLNYLKQGMSCQFKVILNPVISKSQGKNSGMRGRLLPHVSAEHQLNYFLSRSNAYGISIENNQVEIIESGNKLLRKDPHLKLSLVYAVYQGVLKINDIEVFKNCLINGIGKKKAYGFGLMTVIPVSQNE